jgi:hypothetical protein
VWRGCLWRITDGSGIATSAVLSQQQVDDEAWHPVAFLSKALNPVERNYEIHDTKMLAIIRGLEEWRHYLEGARHPVEIWTDHKNLEYFRVAQKLQHHDTCIAGHAGRFKTLELIARNYWWPQMSHYIGIYVKHCDLCNRTKVQHQRPMGELHPSETPEAPWDTNSVDFIVELPESNGYDTIMCVVDSLTKRAHFIPTHTTINAEGTALLFHKEVWKHHRTPRVVVSDRGPQFIATFTRELYKLLGIKLATSMAYHSQTNGQTERVNQVIEGYLHIFTSR